jgi:hypothetical protein
MIEMGILERIFQKWQEPEGSAEGPPSRGRDDRALMESIAEFDEDPDVRKAAEELLASGALGGKPT